MAASLTSALASSDPSPFLFPDELLGEIFTHCDAPTLAAVSRVSFACLELTTKLLYTDITLRDVKSIIKLFKLKSTARSPCSLSDRVRAHTSISLVQSVTLYDGGDMDTLALDAYKPFPAPLQISVLAISLPTRDVRQRGGRRLPGFEANSAIDLFNPRILILRGRRAPLRTPLLDGVRSVYLHGLLATTSALAWNRLTLVIQSGARIAFSDLFSFQARVCRQTGSPVKLVWDFLDIETGFERQVALKTACQWIDSSCVELSQTHCHVRAWVASEDIKVGALATESACLSASEARKFREAAIRIPSDRVRRLRDAFVDHSVRKDMDWAALDDL